MSGQTLDYARLVQHALLGVARDALRWVSHEGLPAEHHFYLTFRTAAPGVVVPERLRAQHPQEMTIVLQHVFWDLAVDEVKFSVTLRFGGQPEHLEVPFAALTAFVDPAAHFGLRFEAQGAGAAGPAQAATQDASLVSGSAKPAPVARRKGQAKPAAPPASGGAKRAKRAPTARPAAGPSEAKVVDLAAFRKTATEREDGEPGPGDDGA